MNNLQRMVHLAKTALKLGRWRKNVYRLFELVFRWMVKIFVPSQKSMISVKLQN